MGQIQNQTHLNTMPLLQSVFAFDDNDLIANRYGQISDIQKLHLRDYYLKRKHHKLLILVIVIIGLIGKMNL